MNNETPIEKLTIPDPFLEPNKEFKTAMANSKRSAAMGVWMVIVPLFFLFCVFMKYYFHVNLQIFAIMDSLFASMEGDPVMRWLSPVLFMIFPLVSVALNAMAMMNIQWNSLERKAVITIRFRIVNLFLFVLSLGIVCVICLFLITKTIKG